MSENKNNKPEKEVTKIEVKEPLTFESMLDGKLITQADLAASINSLLSGVFADYEGCHLTPNVQFPNVLDIALYFKDKGPVTDGRLKSVISTKIPEANTPFARIKSMNLRNQEKNFDLNEDTKQALSELMYPSNGQFDKETGLPKVNWKQCACEIAEPNGFGLQNIYVKVIGVRLESVLRKIYGSKDDEGNRVEYNVQLINGLVNIQRINVNLLNELVAKIGIVPAVGQIPMHHVG